MAELDGSREKSRNLAKLLSHLDAAVRTIIRRRGKASDVEMSGLVDSYEVYLYAMTTELGLEVKRNKKKDDPNEY